WYGGEKTGGGVVSRVTGGFRPCWLVWEGSPRRVGGGGVPCPPWVFMPSPRRGPPLRSFRCRCASLHHGLGPHPPNRRMWHECSSTPCELRLDQSSRHDPSVPACSKP